MTSESSLKPNLITNANSSTCHNLINHRKCKRCCCCCCSISSVVDIFVEKLNVLDGTTVQQLKRSDPAKRQWLGSIARRELCLSWALSCIRSNCVEALEHAGERHKNKQTARQANRQKNKCRSRHRQNNPDEEIPDQQQKQQRVVVKEHMLHLDCW
ncbi:hypothetical protein HELRODRAFT_180089 [Helobdella robusta]|uniref:Uncharacterized protein n=1 Tax=Helobdella robusta TaxID=6412 RepID=T1FFG4_HELRO|nr:hypothetical protein HELRODRAFT_180089 [Helobdella robusta]ESN94759.1 hypothetical protein HELRODRAFT_180089 [Helobdella robusta]